MQKYALQNNAKYLKIERLEDKEQCQMSFINKLSVKARPFYQHVYNPSI